MPITYRFDPELWLVEVRYTGPISVSDLRASLQQMVDENLFDRDLRLLGDITGTQAEFNSNELIHYQEWRKRLPRFAKMALVASTDYEYGLARQFELATNAIGGTEFRIFRSMQEARRWLGIPES